MRQIGTLSDKHHADRFSDYLLSQGVSSTAEEQDGSWVVWVRDEDQLDLARDALGEFVANPEDHKYLKAVGQAEQLRKKQRQEQRARQRATVDVRRDVWGPPTARRIPVTIVLISISVGVTLISNFGKKPLDTPMRELSFCDRSHVADVGFDPRNDGWIDIQSGELWRSITPIFIHYDLMHILFNMLLFYPLAGLIESRRGSHLLGILVIVIAFVSNVGEYLISHQPWFGGMSGVVYGLFGYIWIRMLRHPEEGLRVHSNLIMILMVWLVLGFSGALRMFGMDIANWAHLFGLLAGVGLAMLLPSRLKRRRSG